MLLIYTNLLFTCIPMLYIWYRSSYSINLFQCKNSNFKKSLSTQLRKMNLFIDEEINLKKNYIYGHSKSVIFIVAFFQQETSLKAVVGIFLEIINI